MVIVGCMDYMDEVTLDVDWLRNQLLERDWVKVDNNVSPTIEVWSPSEKSPIVFDKWRDGAYVQLSLNRGAPDHGQIIRYARFVFFAVTYGMLVEPLRITW